MDRQSSITIVQTKFQNFPIPKFQIQMTNDKQTHWQTIYKTKQSHEVSWTQEKPQTSLDFIHSFNLSKTASIIDIGGGDSKLVDHLLDEGFENITVLDISAEALSKAQQRLNEKAKKIKWIVGDVTDFHTTETYDVWHDRAVFHFLTQQSEIEKYVETANRCVKKFLVVGTFSTEGPNKCSGLDVKQYNEEQMCSAFTENFEKINCITEDHTTPFGIKQNFLFCSFRRKNSAQ